MSNFVGNQAIKVNKTNKKIVIIENICIIVLNLITTKIRLKYQISKYL